MRIEFNPDGTVLNTFEDGSPGDSDWWPDDTVIRAESPEGDPMPYGPLSVSRHQAADWPARAARVWNASTNTWDQSGGTPDESDLEKAIRLLRNNPVPELPASPSAADVITQVRLHQKYLEGYRGILLKLLTFIGRRLFNG